jgi:glyoxylase I family protein
MPTLTGHHHVSLTVTDLAASADWYRRVLGLVEAFREEAEGRRACVLRFAHGPFAVGLVQHGAGGGPFDPAVTGLDHAAFAVATADELDAWTDHLTASGVAHSGPVEIPPGRILNLTDPDGIALALFWDRPA